MLVRRGYFGSKGIFVLMNKANPEGQIDEKTIRANITISVVKKPYSKKRVFFHG